MVSAIALMGNSGGEPVVKSGPLGDIRVDPVYAGRGSSVEEGHVRLFDLREQLGAFENAVLGVVTLQGTSGGIEAVGCEWEGKIVLMSITEDQCGRLLTACHLVKSL